VAGNRPREGEPVGVVVLRRDDAWPPRRRLRLARLSKLGTPVLVVAALLFGAAVSATVLVSVWGHEAGRRHAAEAKLTSVSQRADALAAANARLRRRLAGSRATSTRLARSAAQLRASAQALLRENAALVASAGRLHGQGGSLQGRSATVSKLAGTLGSDLVAVLSYISTTNAGSLDPSYLKAQLDYLRPAVANIRAAANALGTDAGSYGRAVDGFATQAESYAAALRRLADEQG